MCVLYRSDKISSNACNLLLHSSDTEEEAVENAMNKYAYYQCFKCKKAYFGGEAQCQADAGDVSHKSLPFLFICRVCLLVG